MRYLPIVLFAGLFVAVASWVPLWIVAAQDPYSMPIILAVLGFFGSLVGGVVALVALVRLIILASRALKQPG